MTATDRKEATRQAFLADIIAHPEDDAPRLIFADWLDDHGEEERAKFIRIQCELALLAAIAERNDPRDNIGLGWSLPEPMKSRGTALNWAQDRLLRCHVMTPNGTHIMARREWCGDSLQAVNPMCCHFSRGFVAIVNCSLKVWFDHGKRIVRSQPLETVHLTDRVPSQDVAGVFSWTYGFGWGELADDLPWEIYQHLGTAQPQDYRDNWSRYLSVAKAQADLSRACLLWARSAD